MSWLLRGRITVLRFPCHVVFFRWGNGTLRGKGGTDERTAERKEGRKGEYIISIIVEEAHNSHSWLLTMR